MNLVATTTATRALQNVQNFEIPSWENLAYGTRPRARDPNLVDTNQDGNIKQRTAWNSNTENATSERRRNTSERRCELKMIQEAVVFSLLCHLALSPASIRISSVFCCCASTSPCPTRFCRCGRSLVAYGLHRPTSEGWSLVETWVRNARPPYETTFCEKHGSHRDSCRGPPTVSCATGCGHHIGFHTPLRRRGAAHVDGPSSLSHAYAINAPALNSSVRGNAKLVVNQEKLPENG